MRDSVIVSAVRTPIGNFDGALKELSALDLGSIAIKEAVQRAGIDPSQVDEVIMGNVLPSGLGQNPARQAMIRACLPMTAGALTINKVCGSGLKAVMLAAQAIACGDAEVIVAGGMESMNNAPYYLEKARFGYRMGNSPLIDGMVHDGLLDIVNNYHMGYTAELVAKKFAVSREDMDRFAFLSNKRAMESITTGLFQEEIIPLTVKKKGGESVVATDEGPRAATMEILAALKPAFNKDGVSDRRKCFQDKRWRCRPGAHGAGKSPVTRHPAHGTGWCSGSSRRTIGRCAGRADSINPEGLEKSAADNRRY